MTNDTTTLNGALTELGETMADNLVTMGVTNADPSDGLTTLANKILLVPQGSCLSVALTSNKSILSYADSDTCTLSATVTQNGSPKSGATVEFFKGSTSLGTSTTNSSGVATKSYSSTGAGDLSFTAKVGSLVSETFALQDCKFYDSLTENHNKWTVSGSMSDNDHTSNGWKYGNSSALVWLDINNFSLTSGANIEFTPTESYSGPNGSYAPIMVYFETQSQSRAYIVQANSFFQANSSTHIDHNISLNSEYRIEYTGTTLKFYLDDTLLGSASHNLGTSNIKVRLATGGNRYCRLKDFKIKPL